MIYLIKGSQERGHSHPIWKLYMRIGVNTHVSIIYWNIICETHIYEYHIQILICDTHIWWIAGLVYDNHMRVSKYSYVCQAYYHIRKRSYVCLSYSCNSYMRIKYVFIICVYHMRVSNTCIIICLQSYTCNHMWASYMRIIDENIICV